MLHRAALVALLVLVVGSVAGAVAPVTVGTFPQRLTQSEHRVSGASLVSVDDHVTVYAGSDVDGYDVTVRNDDATKMTVNVTVRLSTLDGTVVATASEETVVLTGTIHTFGPRFAAPVVPSSFDRTVVVVTVS